MTCRRAPAPAPGPLLDRSSQRGGVRRRGLDAVPRAPSHHVAVPPYDERPRLRLGGWRGKASPLVPPRRQRVVIRNIHRRRLGAAGEGGLLRRRGNFRRWLRYHSCGLLLRRVDFRLRPRLSGRGRLMRLHGRRRRQRHYDWRTAPPPPAVPQPWLAPVAPLPPPAAAPRLTSPVPTPRPRPRLARPRSPLPPCLCPPAAPLTSAA
jgi:hypothetical protein